MIIASSSSIVPPLVRARFVASEARRFRRRVINLMDALEKSLKHVKTVKRRKAS